MKKNISIFITLLLLVLSQSLAIKHIYGSKHLYHNTETSCSECTFLNHCAGADVPEAVVVLDFDFQDTFEQHETSKIPLFENIYAYLSQAPPLC